MGIEQSLPLVPVFVLVFFRLAGMMVAAPVFGGGRIPQRVKVGFALVLAVGVMPGVAVPVSLPASTWDLAAGIAGELIFGIAIGAALNLVFMAMSWAGDMIGQQMGLGMGEVFDPGFGQGGSVVGDIYFMLALVIFLIVGGHRAYLRGAFATFHALPLLSAGMTEDLLDLGVGLLQSATALALQLAAPVLITMLATEVVLGFIGKTIPHINVMTAGLSLRSLIGLVVLLFGAMLSSEVIRQSLLESVSQISRAWSPAAG